MSCPQNQLNDRGYFWIGFLGGTLNAGVLLALIHFIF